MALIIGDLHNDTAVKFARDRAVGMDSAPQKTPIRPEKGAGAGIPLRKRSIGKYLPFVLINGGGKLRTGGHAFAGKFKGTCLPVDHDVIPQVHAAAPALAAGERHRFTTPYGIQTCPHLQQG